MSLRVTFIVLIVSAFSMSHCGPVHFSEIKQEALTKSAVPICDPFGGGSKPPPGHGLVGHINYLTPDQNGPLGSVMDYYFNSNGHVPNPVFLSDLIIPTRFFKSGFSDKSNNPVTANDGSPLVRDFSLHATSVFVLGNWAPGDYQLAMLSDDGSIFSLKGGQANGSDFVINNDGVHATQLGCTTNILHITADSKFPLTIDYYQGPPTSIGMILLARPLSPGNPQDEQCGRGGNDDAYFFFDQAYPVPPTEQQPYIDVKMRGWVPVDGSHFELPSGVTNPCS